MTRLDIQMRVKALREELETRHKLGTVKTAAAFDGKTASTKELRNELFSLLYRLNKFE
jgi:hypothetical protein